MSFLAWASRLVCWSAAADSPALVSMSARQLAPNGGQPAGHGPVNKLIPDLDGNSTHNRGVNHDIQVNLVPVGGGQRVGELPALAHGQLDRRPHHRDQLLPAP